MSNIVGVSLNINNSNFTFKQDAKNEWVKIDNVAIGEESGWGYAVKNSNNDIGGLLDRCRSDPKIVAVVYDWNSGNAYCKSGFNLNVKGDYQYKVNFSTFVLKSRVNSSWLQPVTPAPIPIPIQESNVVKIINGHFVLNDSLFKPVGVNIYWLGLTEQHEYPSQQLIEQMFKVASNLSSTVIRSHTLGISSGSRESLLENLYNKVAWAPIDYSFMMANKYNIKLICPLTDNYWWSNGNYGDFCKKRGIAKDKFWTDPDVRNDFKSYISTWLNHTNQYTGIQIKNDPSLFLIELGNELGNIRNAPDGSTTTIPTQEWLSDISKYIKSIDSVHLVLDGTDEALGKCGDFNVDSIDVYSSHFYWNDYNRISTYAKMAKDLGKPYIIGEYSGHFGDDWFNSIINNNLVSGMVMWDLYPLGVKHDDGETLYYGDQNCTTELLRIANYHRKVRGLPIIYALP
jgi:mannan endo-1,4-beta-mannosidase